MAVTGLFPSNSQIVQCRLHFLKAQGFRSLHFSCTYMLHIHETTFLMNNYYEFEITHIWHEASEKGCEQITNGCFCVTDLLGKVPITVFHKWRINLLDLLWTAPPGEVTQQKYIMELYSTFLVSFHFLRVMSTRMDRTRRIMLHSFCTRCNLARGRGHVQAVGFTPSSLKERYRKWIYCCWSREARV